MLFWAEAELYAMLPCFICCSHGYRNFNIEIHSLCPSVHPFVHFLFCGFWCLNVFVLVDVPVDMVTHVDRWLETFGLMSFSFINIYIFPIIPWLEVDLNLIVFQFQLRGGCVSKWWAQANSLWHGRSPKETLTAICSSTTVHQVGSHAHTHAHTHTEEILNKLPLCQREVGLNFEIWGGRIPLWLGFSVCQEGLCNLLLIKAPLKGSHSWEMRRTEKFVLHLCQVWDKGVFSAAYMEPVSRFENGTDRHTGQ